MIAVAVEAEVGAIAKSAFVLKGKSALYDGADFRSHFFQNTRSGLPEVAPKAELCVLTGISHC